MPFRKEIERRKRKEEYGEKKAIEGETGTHVDA